MISTYRDFFRRAKQTIATIRMMRKNPPIAAPITTDVGRPDSEPDDALCPCPPGIGDRVVLPASENKIHLLKNKCTHFPKTEQKKNEVKDLYVI